MIDQTLKTEIEKYQNFSGYMTDEAIIGTRVGFVRKLIDNSSKRTAELPALLDIERLTAVINDKTQPAETRVAVNNLLRVVAELQTQVRGMQIEHAEEQRRISSAMGDASDAKVS